MKSDRLWAVLECLREDLAREADTDGVTEIRIAIRFDRDGQPKVRLQRDREVRLGIQSR